MSSGIDEPLAPDQPPEPPIPIQVAPAKAERRPTRASTFGSWVLLNPYTALHAHSLTLGVVGFRPLPAARESPGYSLAFGETVTTLRGPFAAGVVHDNELRFVPKDALSLALSRYQWEAGPRLGRLEPMARVGFTLLHVDVGHGVSFGIFSPRVGFGLWLRLPHARVGVSAFSEFFWRLAGDESAFVHGLTLEFQPEAPKLLSPRVTSSLSSPARR
jgi:hypothetical protein